MAGSPPAGRTGATSLARLGEGRFVVTRRSGRHHGDQPDHHPALRTVGFAAWLRTPSQGSWPFHFGRNGLANHAADDTPPAYRVAFTWWEKYRRG